ncbi:MAG: divergent PAP2 family protein [Pseudobutyrivibrio sp.]|nr:divergent PAP2 family protein [Pseudobutyrivibrio sp.]
MGQFFYDMFTNKLFLAPAAGWFFAQVIKIFLDTLKNGFNPDRLTGSGGMPSSHSATVMGLLVAASTNYGPKSSEFVFAFFLAVIVIYDAAGVRLETQRQGFALNILNKERASEGKEPLIDRMLREKMGHTVPEILVGMVIGTICGLVVNILPFMN